MQGQDSQQNGQQGFGFDQNQQGQNGFGMDFGNNMGGFNPMMGMQNGMMPKFGMGMPNMMGKSEFLSSSLSSRTVKPTAIAGMGGMDPGMMNNMMGMMGGMGGMPDMMSMMNNPMMNGMGGMGGFGGMPNMGMGGGPNGGFFPQGGYNNNFGNPMHNNFNDRGFDRGFGRGRGRGWRARGGGYGRGGWNNQYGGQGQFAQNQNFQGQGPAMVNQQRQPMIASSNGEDGSAQPARRGSPVYEPMKGPDGDQTESSKPPGDGTNDATYDVEGERTNSVAPDAEVKPDDEVEGAPSQAAPEGDAAEGKLQLT